MADKTHSSGDFTLYQPGNADFGATPPQKTHWTDGLPHDFTGWGPRTPDPDEPAAPLPAGELTWGGAEDRHHYVWSFDGRRHHHH